MQESIGVLVQRSKTNYNVSTSNQWETASEDESKLTDEERESAKRWKDREVDSLFGRIKLQVGKWQIDARTNKPVLKSLLHEMMVELIIIACKWDLTGSHHAFELFWGHAKDLGLKSELGTNNKRIITPELLQQLACCKPGAGSLLDSLYHSASGCGEFHRLRATVYFVLA